MTYALMVDDVNGVVNRERVREVFEQVLDLPTHLDLLATPGDATATDRARERWGTGPDAERGMAGMMNLGGKVVG